jgi:hypothetical protein
MGLMLSNEVLGACFYFSLGFFFTEDIRDNFEFIFSFGLFPNVTDTIGDPLLTKDLELKYC